MRRVSTQYQHRYEHEDDEAEDNRITQSLAGMAVALFLVVASLFVVQSLEQKGNVEDCLLAGRSNCDAMVTGGR